MFPDQAGYFLTVPFNVTIVPPILGASMTICRVWVNVPTEVGTKAIAIGELDLPGAMLTAPPPPPLNGGVAAGTLTNSMPLPTFLRIRFAVARTPTPLLLRVNVFGIDSLPGNPLPVTGMLNALLAGSLLSTIIVALSAVASGWKVTVRVSSACGGISKGPDELRVNAVPG